MNSQIQQASSCKQSETYDNLASKCAKWLETVVIDDDGESVYSETSCSSDFSRFSTGTEGATGPQSHTVGDREVFLNKEMPIQEIESIISQPQNVYANIRVTKSKNVHLGNVTYINGPVYINQTSSVINQQITVNQHTNTNDDDDECKPPFMVRRTYWLAQPPLSDYTYLDAPAKFVIISHSATEEGFSQPANVLLVRLIQQFHIESRYFDDIGYNFLIGADGNVYEGRGWNVVGAHTFSYNKYSIGICFIGCFTMKMPTAAAIRKARKLIAFGVKIGCIDEEYTLLGHCQCTSTESPGRVLYEELKTWERHDPYISVEKPSPLIHQ